MAHSISEPPPFFALFANSGTPTWSDIMVGFCSLYHLMQKGIWTNALDAIKQASGNPEFVLIRGNDAKQEFDDAMKKFINDILQKFNQTPLTPQAPVFDPFAIPMT